MQSCHFLVNNHSSAKRRSWPSDITALHQNSTAQPHFSLRARSAWRRCMLCCQKSWVGFLSLSGSFLLAHHDTSTVIIPGPLIKTFQNEQVWRHPPLLSGWASVSHLGLQMKALQCCRFHKHNGEVVFKARMFGGSQTQSQVWVLTRHRVSTTGRLPIKSKPS